MPATSTRWRCGPHCRRSCARGRVQWPRATTGASQRATPDQDLLEPLYQALDAGDSLILFPEGTRNHDIHPQAFKSGLFHLARRYPQVEFIAVYLDNARRCLPKGSLVPVPLVCTVRFGAPIALRPDEEKDAFLERARAAVVALA